MLAAEADYSGEVDGMVALFYHYKPLHDPRAVCEWQRRLCVVRLCVVRLCVVRLCVVSLACTLTRHAGETHTRADLDLRGNVRIASEGINGSVSGSREGVLEYVRLTAAHSDLRPIPPSKFNLSAASRTALPSLRVRVCDEIVPICLAPEVAPVSLAAKHLTVSLFHSYVDGLLDPNNAQVTPENTVLIDCRNFYETRIGRFRGAVCPNVRKFKLWPTFVQQSADQLRGKTVLMYCTGGIRCERASAYLLHLGLCQDVLQLEGGIHKYLEQFPDGHFRGKLYVFDDRVAIKTNSDVVATCFHCPTPHDSYLPCSSPHCRLVVLCCAQCRARGVDYCCVQCHEVAVRAAEEGRKAKEQCLCTQRRVGTQGMLQPL